MNTLNNIPLQLTILQFTITLVHQFQLPVYPAITIRGGLGYALQQV